MLGLGSIWKNFSASNNMKTNNFILPNSLRGVKTFSLRVVALLAELEGSAIILHVSGKHVTHSMAV